MRMVTAADGSGSLLMATFMGRTGAKLPLQKE
jgi:hypothetical protein